MLQVLSAIWAPDLSKWSMLIMLLQTILLGGNEKQIKPIFICSEVVVMKCQHLSGAYRASPSLCCRFSSGLLGADRASRWVCRCRQTPAWRRPSTATPWCSPRPTRGLSRTQTKDRQTTSSATTDNYGEKPEKKKLIVCCFRQQTWFLHHKPSLLQNASQPADADRGSD